MEWGFTPGLVYVSLSLLRPRKLGSEFQVTEQPWFCFPWVSSEAKNRCLEHGQDIVPSAPDDGELRQTGFFFYLPLLLISVPVIVTL